MVSRERRDGDMDRVEAEVESKRNIERTALSSSLEIA